MTEQLALMFAVEKLHGCITVQFSRGRRPVQCVLMTNDLLWYDGEGDTAEHAIEAAIASSNDDSLRSAWDAWTTGRCSTPDRHEATDSESTPP